MLHFNFILWVYDKIASSVGCFMVVTFCTYSCKQFFLNNTVKIKERGKQQLCGSGLTDALGLLYRQSFS